MFVFGDFKINKNNMAYIVILFFLIFFPLHAQSRSVLMLTTDESRAPAGAGNTRNALDNMEIEFNQGISGSINRLTGVLSVTNGINEETFVNPLTNQPYDIVLIGTGFGAITQSNWAVLQNAMSNRSANAFLMFMDGCWDCGNKVNELAAALTTITGYTIGATGADNTPSQQPYFLNTESPSQGNFVDLNPIYGFYTRYFSGVPADNVLYKRRLINPNTQDPPNPAPGTTADAFGIFIPVSDSNDGAGACLFAVADLNVFIDDPTSGWQLNRGKIAPAFLSAVGAGGACEIPASIEKSFSPESIGAGDVSTLVLTVGNLGETNLTGVNVIDALPSPLIFDGDASIVESSCFGGTVAISQDSTSFSLLDAQVLPGGCTISLPVRWPASHVAECVSPTNTRTNMIAPAIGFTTDQGQAPTEATADLTCIGSALNIRKEVVLPTGVMPEDLGGNSFGFDVACASETGDSIPVVPVEVVLDSDASSGSQTIAPIVRSGQCIITEVSRPEPPAGYAWLERTLPSASVVIETTSDLTVATITNTLVKMQARPVPSMTAWPLMLLILGVVGVIFGRRYRIHQQN